MYVEGGLEEARDEGKGRRKDWSLLQLFKKKRGKFDLK